MKLAVITLCDKGARLAAAVADSLAGCDVYVHRDVTELASAERFDRVTELTERIFTQYDGLIFIMPTGVVVRAIAGQLQHKLRDPAVVAVDVGGRWAVSLLSGHEGGANDLAGSVANILEAEPVISTTTEAVKTIIVGVGCRRGTDSETILAAIGDALALAGKSVDDVRLIASADIKSDEPGLIAAAASLGLPLRFISSKDIRNCDRKFERSEFVQEKVNLPAVAEPVALLAGVRTELLLAKQKYQSVTVAIAAERCLWSE